VLFRCLASHIVNTSPLLSPTCAFGISQRTPELCVASCRSVYLVNVVIFAYFNNIYCSLLFLGLFNNLSQPRKSRDSSVGIALGYWLDDRHSRVRVPAGAENFSLHHRVQHGSGAHPASYPMGTRGSFPGRKAAGD
jgi:hypothetical protein